MSCLVTILCYILIKRKKMCVIIIQVLIINKKKKINKVLNSGVSSVRAGWVAARPLLKNLLFY